MTCHSCSNPLAPENKSGLCAYHYYRRNDDKRDEMIEAYVSGQTLEEVGARFGIGRTTVWRVITTHAPHLRKKAQIAQLDEILVLVAAFFAVPPSLIRGKSRKQRAVRIRHIFCWVAHNAGHPYARIGRAISRDHTTAMHGQWMVKERMKREAALPGIIERLSAHVAAMKPNVAQRMEAVSVMKLPRARPSKKPEKTEEELILSDAARQNRRFMAAIRAAHPERLAA